MKWLFALLVALNLIVFGGTVAYRMAVKQNQTVQASAPLEGRTHELPRPETLTPKSSPPVSDSVPEWVAQSEKDTAAAEPETEKTENANVQELPVESDQDKKAREEQEAKAKEKEKKEREEKLKREKERKEKAAERQNAASEQGRPAQQCSTATVAIDEDDYHRIKGLLGRWPHAATRSVERRASKKNAQKPSKNYRVLIPTGGDAVAQLENLNAKGFNGTLHNGEISVGVTHSRSAAQIIISRLSSANIGGARIVEDEEGGGVSDGTLSVARMHITFMSVDSRTAQDINNVVGRYGKLNVKNCK